jgi:hypothetical protein
MLDTVRCLLDIVIHARGILNKIKILTHYNSLIGSITFLEGKRSKMNLVTTSDCISVLAARDLTNVTKLSASDGVGQFYLSIHSNAMLRAILIVKF